MKRHHQLLIDILEMIHAEHDLGSISVAGDGFGGRFCRPVIDGVLVDLRHNRLEEPIVDVSIYNGHSLCIYAQIEDRLDGEMVAQFVSLAVAKVSQHSRI